MSERRAAVIYSYTRAQAIADGVLCDLTIGDFANAWRTSPFASAHIACTAAAFAAAIEPGQHGAPTMAACYFAVLEALYLAILSRPVRARDIAISFRVEVAASSLRLKAVVHGGDHAEQCLTFMLPHED
ncbi:MAG TPA: DUF6573 family protein [Steroidobacteraceae bacterium]|jgi:hypothetical protein|nr:DUF6573 family protein [Steroidobacteraceae bacterium]